MTYNEEKATTPNKKTILKYQQIYSSTVYTDFETIQEKQTRTNDVINRKIINQTYSITILLLHIFN